MFRFHLESLKDIFKKLKEKSDNKIKQRTNLEKDELIQKLNEKLKEIFESNGLEHIGQNEFSNKTHGEMTEETLIVKIKDSIVDTKEELKLELKVLAKIGQFDEEFKIYIKSKNNMYYIEIENEEDKHIDVYNMKEELEKKLEEGFNKVKETI